MIIIKSYEEFESYLDQELGVSSWHKITQEQIDNFAKATLDHQWIHVDPERAKTESPFKATIAHGYLTLSLVPYFWKQVVDVQNLAMEVNYGLEAEEVDAGFILTCQSHPRSKKVVVDYDVK